MKNKWLKLATWVAGYVNVIAFAILYGVNLLNPNAKDESIKRTNKRVLITYLIFFGLTLLFDFIYYLICIFTKSVPYSTSRFFNVIDYIIIVFKILGFAGFACYDLFSEQLAEKITTNKENKEPEIKAENAEEK